MHADVDGMIDEAVDASREGGLVDASAATPRRRGLRGHPAADQLLGEAVPNEVDEIVEKINRDPVTPASSPAATS